MSALVISGLLGLVTNILTADDKYSLHNSENLGQAIQMQLYKKRKNFSKFFASLLKCTTNFQPFDKKDVSHSLCVSEIHA